MKSFSSFFQICVYLTLIMFIFSLCVSYISGLNVFGITVEEGFQPGSNFSDTFAGVTRQPEYLGGISMDLIWGLVLTGAGIAGLFLAWVTRSTAIIGILIFSISFWAAYGNCLSILNPMGWVDPNLIGIGTAAMGFIWVGAIIGMLTGSG